MLQNSVKNFNMVIRKQGSPGVRIFEPLFCNFEPIIFWVLVILRKGSLIFKENIEV